MDCCLNNCSQTIFSLHLIRIDYIINLVRRWVITGKNSNRLRNQIEVKIHLWPSQKLDTKQMEQISYCYRRSICKKKRGKTKKSIYSQQIFKYSFSSINYVMHKKWKISGRLPEKKPPLIPISPTGIERTEKKWKKTDWCKKTFF